MANNEKVFEFNPENPDEKKSVEMLLTLAFKNGRYWLYHSRDFTYQDALVNPAEQVWIVLKNMNKNIFKDKLHKKFGYKLKGGDTIKFGRVRFVIKKISSDSTYEPNPTLIMQEDNESPMERKNFLAS